MSTPLSDYIVQLKPRSLRWLTDEQAATYLIEGQEELCSEDDWLFLYRRIAVVNGVGIVGSDSPFGEGAREWVSCTLPTGQPCARVTPVEWERYQARTEVGLPQVWMGDTGAIETWPKGEATAIAVGVPPKIAPTDVLSNMLVPDRWRNVLLTYAERAAHRDIKDWATVDDCTARIDRFLLQMRDSELPPSPPMVAVYYE